MGNPSGDDSPIVFSPQTFARHREAVDYVLGDVQTRAPRKGSGRSSGPAPGAWGLLEAGHTITAASGTTLGTGSVKLCDKDGVPIGTDDAYGEVETVPVLNAGAAIDGGGAGKIVGMEWTAGDWSVCGCGVITTPSCLTGCGCFNVGAKIQINDSTLGITNDLDYSTSAGSNPWGRAKSWVGVAPFAYTGYGGGEPKTVPVYYNLDATTCKLSIGWYADVGGTEYPLDDTSNPANFVWVDAPEPYFNTCDPFERYVDYFDWSAGPTTDSMAWSNLYSGSQTSLTVTSPYSTTQCCVRFPVNGCNGKPLPGAVVKVWTNSSKTTLIGEGVTGPTGIGPIIDVHSHGSIYYEASCDRFTTGTRTVNVTVCGNSVGTLTLLPAPGYHCIIANLCVFPWKDTLQATDKYGHAITLTWDGTGTAGWKGTSPIFTYPGFGSCSPVSNYSYDVLFTGDLYFGWKRAGASGPSAICPGTSNDFGLQPIENNLNFVCPPTGAMVSEVVTQAAETNNLFCSVLGDHDFIITE